MLWIIFLLIFTPAFGFEEVSTRTKRKQRRLVKQTLNDTERMRGWFDDNNITNGTCFIHIPRTGGISLQLTASELNISIDRWHSEWEQPRTDCGCVTNLRDPVDRYISEWKFYGLNYFYDEREIFGWKPALGFPKSFDEFIQDPSTHNAMTKILSGCQLYSNCIVNEHNVYNIVDRVQTNCLGILKTENMPVHAHQKVFEDGDTDWEERARNANKWDVLLYEEIMKINA